MPGSVPRLVPDCNGCSTSDDESPLWEMGCQGIDMEQTVSENSRESGWQSQLEVARKTDYFARRRTYKLLLDGVKIGEIKDGKTEIFQIEPGMHSIQCKVDWIKSNLLQFQTKPGEIVRLSIERESTSSLRHWSALVLMGLCTGIGLTLRPLGFLLIGFGWWMYVTLEYKVSIRITNVGDGFDQALKILDPIENEPEDSIIKVRIQNAWIWIISISYIFLSVLLFIGSLTPVDPTDFSSRELAYFESEATTQKMIGGVFIPLFYLCGAISLLLLRRVAFNLFLVGLVLSATDLVWDIFVRDYLQTFPIEYQIAEFILFAINIIVCLYTWKLTRRGTLQ